MTMHHSKSRGFTLVESLVALVVLSVGMLGIAALYVESLRSNRSALLRSQAMILATDMADRIRSNPAGGDSYAKSEDETGTPNDACDPGGAGGCTAEDMAAHDVARWVEVVDDRYDAPEDGVLALPGGRGSIVVAAIAGATVRSYTITVSWSESGQATANSVVLRIEA